MNWSQFKEPVCQLSLVGAVIASWSLKQEVVGSSHFTGMTNIFVTESVEFNGKKLGKSQIMAYLRDVNKWELVFMKSPINV